MRSGGVLTGWARDISPEGALLLQTPDGLIELYEGEVEQLRLGGDEPTS